MPSAGGPNRFGPSLPAVGREEASGGNRRGPSLIGAGPGGGENTFVACRYSGPVMGAGTTGGGGGVNSVSKRGAGGGSWDSAAGARAASRANAMAAVSRPSPRIKVNAFDSGIEKQYLPIPPGAVQLEGFRLLPRKGAGLYRSGHFGRNTDFTVWKISSADATSRLKRRYADWSSTTRSFPPLSRAKCSARGRLVYRKTRSRFSR